MNTVLFAGSAGAGGAIFAVIAIAGLIVALVMNGVFGKDFGKKERDR